MEIHKTFRFRLEPNSEQRQLFIRIAGCCRFVFNQGLGDRMKAYEQEGKTLTYEDQCKTLTAMKRDEGTSWLGEAPAQVLQQALKDLQFAYEQFFRQVSRGKPAGFPKFKKKGRKDAFRYPQDVKVKDGRVFLPKIGWVKYQDSRPLEGRLVQATIKREGDHWFVCLTCELASPNLVPAPISDARAVGIDVGLKMFAALSDGTKVENPRFLEMALRKLRRAQKRLTRKVKFSNNWRKQMAKVVGQHIRAKNCRKDFAHKLSTAIVNNHDVIAVEDLNIKGLVKNRRLARAISDVGWGQFFTMLEYKAAWAGKNFVRVDRFLATSQVCSNCGETKAVPLSVRTFACDGCDLELDRDLNASINIRTAGLAVLGFVPNACGGA